MKTYKAKSIAEIESLRCSKADLFESYDGSFDFALPQQWLNDFAAWCTTHRRECTYDLIRSTCVWTYPENVPMTACEQVYFAYQAYRSHFD